MPGVPPFGPVDSGLRTENMLTFIAFTLAFLFVAWLVIHPVRPVGFNLVVLGILVTILSIGYGMIAAPGVMMAVPSLTKIGFLLVLGGLTSVLLATSPAKQERREADYE